MIKQGNSFDQDTTSTIDHRLQQNILVLPILNDPQYLQFCAVHTINNLLQITKDATIETEEGDRDDRTLEERRNRLISDETTRMILVNGDLYTQSKIDFASKKELDTIADEMSNRENALMKREEIENSETNEGISVWNVLRSNHRTLLTGNYSHEVRIYLTSFMIVYGVFSYARSR